MEYNIRNLKSGDCNKLCDLIRSSAQLEDDLKELKVTPEKLKENAFGPKPSYYCSIVENKNADIVGFAIFFYIYSTWNGRSAFLEKMFVEESNHKLEMKKSLFAHICQRVVEHHCVKLRVFSFNENEANFYTKHGARNLTKIEDWHVLDFDPKSMGSTIKEIKTQT